MRALTGDEQRELNETADLFEMIAATNPSDVSALESLVEIYTRLGDAEKLARVNSRLRAAPAPARKGADAPQKTASAKATKRHLLPLGELLAANGLITREQLAEALKVQRTTKEKLGVILVRRNLITEDELIGFLSRQYSIPSVTLSELDVSAGTLRLVPAALAKKYDVLPVKRVNNTLTLAMADPTNVFALDEIALVTNLQILPVVASQTSIRKAIERAYDGQGGTAAESLSELASNVTAAAVEIVEDEDTTKVDAFELKESADEAPVVKLVNMVLGDAIQRGASDIHFEPYEKVCRIRFRIDGVLHEMLAPAKRLEPAITSRLKIMSNLDIAERRLPQDGRIKLRYNEREIDFRVSILPSIFGEKVVLRILDKEALRLDLTQLGFDPGTLELFQKAIREPFGMVLITGPTGSGKTTTLYSAIQAINSPEHNIMTAEDPVEYNLRGVNQFQVNEGVGRTFASILRAFLRQDPDVILVGETRDLETAQISIRAALTGHLVFSTLHTNDCPSTVARLVDMGVPPFLVASSLALILAQRLGRKVCKDCKEPYEIDEDSLVPYGHRPTGRGRVTIYKGRGCTVCNSTGLKGRVALYEVMPMSPELRDMIIKGASTAELGRMAQSQGMRTLRQAGLMKILEGTSTIEEILRVTAAE
jgi:type IV pilus assembly protein PilB